MTGIHLWFTNKNSPTLERTLYWNENGSSKVSIRTRILRTTRPVGTFQWTRAVQAFALLMIRYKIVHEKLNFEENQAILAGGKESAAYMFHDALIDEASWLQDIFGRDADGTSSARTLFQTSSGESSQNRISIISVNSKMITSGNITISMQGKIVAERQLLCDLLSSLEKQWNEGELLESFDSMPKAI